jgi:hypothetical protein
MIADTAKKVSVNISTLQRWLREDDNFNAYLNSLTCELKPEPEKTVLKWKRFQKIDKRSHPKNHANVLVADCDNNYHTCVFSRISSDIDFLLLNPTSETDEIINNVIYWMYLPNAPRNEGEIDDEYLIEQTTLETFDIIDAITPALREAVKHLLVQQGVSK